MSEKRTLLSRPRTKVYDCNYNIGEKYYKPMVEQLDRKYSGTNFTPSFNKPLFNDVGTRIRDEEDFLTSRRSLPFVNDFETSTEQLKKFTNDTRNFKDDLEDEIANSIRKLKVTRVAKTSSENDESMSYNDILNDFPKHKRVNNFSNKILDSVGVNGKMQDSLEDEIFKKKTNKIISSFDDESPCFTKWTALREQSFDTDDYITTLKQTAANKARQSKARLADLENEIDTINQKNIIKEKRISDLKSLIAGEDPFLLDNLDSHKLRKSFNITKKVTF